MNRKKKVIIFICIIVCILVNLYFHIDNKKNYTYDNLKMYNTDNKKTIRIKDSEIVQRIVPQYDNFNKIYLYLTVKDFTNDCAFSYKPVNLLFELYDSDNNLIQKYKYEKVFRDGKKFNINFSFSPLKNSKYKAYYLHIKNFMDDDGVSIDLVESKLYGAIIDGKQEQYSLIYFNSYEINKTPIYYYIVPLIVTIITIFVLLYIDKFKNIELKYLFITLIFGIMMLIIIPTYEGHDEYVHYARIYDLSKGNLVVKSDGKWPIINVPLNIVSIDFYNYEEIPKLLNSNIDNSIEKIDGQYTSVYSLLSYLPEVIGFKLMTFFTSNAFVLYYFTRLCNLLFCVFIMYHAIKIIPFGKKMMMFIGVLPSTLLAMNMVSADGILIASFMLFFAKILQLSYTDKEINKIDYIILLISGIFVALSKLVYLPLCALLILIPLNKKDKKIKKNVVIMLIVYLLLTIFWNAIASMNLLDGQGINVIYYLKYYILHPIEFIQMTIHTFVINIGRLISDLFGGINDWNGTYIQDGGIVPVIFAILFINLIYKGENKLNKRDKYIIGIIILITYLLISTVLFFTCTPPNYKVIIGIQGRYFIVFLICLYLMFAKNKNDKTNMDIYNYIIILLGYYYCLELFARYM